MFQVISVKYSLVYLVCFDGFLTKLQTVTADDYQVLSTDYTNYAVEYRCEDRGLFQRRGLLYFITLSLMYNGQFDKNHFLLLVI